MWVGIIIPVTKLLQKGVDCLVKSCKFQLNCKGCNNFINIWYQFNQNTVNKGFSHLNISFQKKNQNKISAFSFYDFYAVA